MNPLIGITMGSDSDLPVMQAASDILKQFDIPHEVTVVSAHRTPHRMIEYAQKAKERGLKVIIARRFWTANAGPRGAGRHDAVPESTAHARCAVRRPNMLAHARAATVCRPFARS